MSNEVEDSGVEKSVTAGEKYHFFGQEPTHGVEPSHYAMIDREIKLTRDHKKYFLMKRLNRHVVPNCTNS